MRYIALLCAILTAACWTMVATPGHAAVAGKSIAFQGTYHGKLSLSISGTSAKGTVDATGTATKVGKGKLHSQDGGTGNPLQSCGDVTGTGTLTGKGSAKLSYSYKFHTCRGDTKQNGTFTITGGTGKLKGAKGNGTYKQIFHSSPPGPLDVKFNGTLRLP